MATRRLVRDLTWAMALKLVALTAIYILFFASHPSVDAARIFLPATTSAGQP